jgi:hypothetical protein
MRRKLNRETVTNTAQDCAEHMPGHLPIGADLLHQIVEPDMRCLQGFVEDIEAAVAHESTSCCKNPKRGSAKGTAAGRCTRNLADDPNALFLLVPSKLGRS